MVKIWHRHPAWTKRYLKGILNLGRPSPCPLPIASTNIWRRGEGSRRDLRSSRGRRHYRLRRIPDTLCLPKGGQRIWVTGKGGLGTTKDQRYFANKKAMWKVPSRKQNSEPVAAVASVAATQIVQKIQSIGRPQTTLGIGAQRGRGFIFVLTDSLARDVTTPTIPNETIVRALEGSPVVYRNGGFIVEMTPLEDLIKIKCTGPNGIPIEGTFQAEEIERSMKTPTMPRTQNFAFGR